MGASLLRAIAASVGTPAYVYDAAVIRDRYRRWTHAFAGIPHGVHYAVKANSNLAVLRIMRELGAGADIVSGGELARAHAAGFDPSRIVFSGVGKTADELRRAVDAAVGLINLESAAEVEAAGAAAAAAGRVVAVGVRINPDVTADTHPHIRTAGRGIKFGVPLDEAVPACRAVAGHEHLALRSVGVHIGSQVSDAAPYVAALTVIAQVVRDLRAQGVDTLQSVDLGGGAAVPYGPGTPALDPARLAGAVAPLVRALGVTLLLEPGRALVAEAGTLLTRVQYRKHSGGREIAVVDAGMNDLLRPSLYGAEHAIEVVESGGSVRGGGPTDVVGPLCESGDFLGLGRTLPGAGAGALLAVRTVGAYGMTMSSNYNARPRPAEVLVDGDRWGVIRERETVDDLMRGEYLEPQWRA